MYRRETTQPISQKRTCIMDVKEHYAALLGLGDEWSVSSVSLDLEHRRIDIFLRYLPPSAICPVCGRLAAVRDQLEERTWRHLDTMQFATLIHARTPRVDCPGHGAKVIELPWASKHSRFTLLFEAFAIEVLRTARSVKDAGALLRLNWQQTHSIMQAAVKRGMARRTEEEVAFIGMDEKSFRRGQGAEDYLCVLTDLDRHRVLDVGVGRSGEGARQLIGKALTPWQCGMVCAAAIDMSAPFEKSLREALPEADIVFDRFHVQKHLNEGVDATRRQECRRMAGRRDKRLAGTRYLWLKGMGALSDEEEARRKDLLRMSLRTGKAWGFKEMFGWFWKSRDKEYASRNFEHWYGEVVKSGIGPMVRVARTLKRHLYGLLAWFDSRIDNGMTEGFNSAIQELNASARGYRNAENFRTAILFRFGKLEMHPDLVRIGALP